MARCKIKNCDNHVHCRGWCRIHYGRWQRHGDPTFTKRIFHGQHSSREYQAWADMKTRCLNKNNIRFKDYGGRGIRVCDRWMTFDNFIADMGPRPGKGYSLDRIDTNGNYCPENCRWATWRQQFESRRTTKLSQEKVEEIKRLVASGITHERVGAMFGVRGPTVAGIIAGKYWRKDGSDPQAKHVQRRRHIR